MDKFRRNRKTSTPTKAHPSTSSNEAATTASSSSTSAATKFTIQQKIPTGTAPKKGPYSVKRTVDPNEVFIKRRIGEGAKPLFSRDEIRSKRSASPKHKRTSDSSSSSRSSSPEILRNKESTKSKPNEKKSTEKVPYFLDEKREVDRIKRVYGSKRRSRSWSREKSSRNRSRTRSPPSYRRSRHYSSYRRGPNESYHLTKYHHSRSRSRSRERGRNSYSHWDKSVPPATQFIPVPVPVEYPYIPPAWGPPMIPPPRFPYMMRPPIPAPVPFMPRFHPPRYFMPNGFHRGNYRPRY